MELWIEIISIKKVNVDKKYWGANNSWIKLSLHPCNISHTNTPTIKAYIIYLKILNWYYWNLCYKNCKDVCQSYSAGQIQDRDLILEENFSVSLLTGTFNKCYIVLAKKVGWFYQKKIINAIV